MREGLHDERHQIPWKNLGDLLKVFIEELGYRVKFQVVYQIIHCQCNFLALGTIVLGLLLDLICNENFEGPTEKNENGAKEK